jgi:hypothetical protein
LGTVKLGLIVVGAAAALTFSATSPAAPKTTVPTKTILVQVLITDAKITLVQYQNETLGNGQPGYQLFVGTIPRGDYLKFIVLNKGKKLHDFTVFGKTTKPLKPGALARFNKFAKVRGSFPYKSTLDTGKAFRGKIVIA